MANYQHYTEEEEILFVATEHPIYGSSRIGVENRIDTLYKDGNYNPAWYNNDKCVRNLGLKSIELSNHLGNVLVTISDKKVYTIVSTNIVFEPEITTITDYYPFGSAMNTRSYVASTKYRYGFNTQEKDDEVASDNNSYTAEFWQYDGRLGRRFNLDPKPNPSNSDYSCLGNNPNFYNDTKGDTLRIFGGNDNKNIDKAKDDILSLLPEKLRSGVSFTQDQNNPNYYIVNYDFSHGVVGYSHDATETGTILFENLSKDKLNYLYCVLNEEITQGSHTKENFLFSSDNNGVINVSTTKFIPYNRSEESNLVNKGNGIAIGNPHKGFDGQVCLSSTRTWYELGDDGVTIVAKPRASAVFHELWENYERTHNGLPYDFPLYDNSGNTIYTGFMRFAKDNNRDGAHDKAIKAEEKFHNKSKHPGVTE